MKFAEQIKTMERGGDATDMDGKTFEIEANEVLFDALSNNIYTNKIQAVIREVACNAHDANVMVGKHETPIKVYLPNAIEPSFKVVDSGPGMCETAIMDCYTTYGWSDKRNSDDVIGGFGVGTKAPLAYADTFTVVSHHGGMKKTYFIYKDERNFPKIKKIGEEPTGITGMEVIVPVLSADFANFEREAEFVFSFFETEPDVVSLTYTPINWDYTNSTKLGQFTLKEYNYERNCRVIMGNVSYDINIDAMNIPEDDKEKYENLISEANIDMVVPIGFLSVSISRERLSYDKRTTKTLVEMFEKMKDSLYIVYLKGLKQQPTLESAAEYYQNSSLRNKFFSKNEAFWRGLSIKEYLSSPVICKINGLFNSFGVYIRIMNHKDTWSSAGGLEETKGCFVIFGRMPTGAVGYKKGRTTPSKMHYMRGTSRSYNIFEELPNDIVFYKEKPRDYRKRMETLWRYHNVSHGSIACYYVENWEATKRVFAKYAPNTRLWLLDDVEVHPDLKGSKSYSIPDAEVWNYNQVKRAWNSGTSINPQNLSDYKYYVVFNRQHLTGSINKPEYISALKAFGKPKVASCPKSRLKQFEKMEKDGSITRLTKDVAKEVIKENIPDELIKYYTYKDDITMERITLWKRFEELYSLSNKTTKGLDDISGAIVDMIKIGEDIEVTKKKYNDKINYNAFFSEIMEEKMKDEDDHDLCLTTIKKLDKQLNILSHITVGYGMTSAEAEKILTLI